MTSKCSTCGHDRFDHSRSKGKCMIFSHERNWDCDCEKFTPSNSSGDGALNTDTTSGDNQSPQGKTDSNDSAFSFIPEDTQTLSSKAVRDLSKNPIPNYYWEEDVKDFIKKLKYHLKHGLKQGSFTIRNEWKIIEILAGENLI